MGTREKIKDILAGELGVEVSTLRDDQTIQELEMDSLTFIQLLTELQEVLGVEISIHDLNHYQQNAQISTVGDLINLVETELNRHLQLKG